MYGEFVYILRSGPYFKIGRTTDITKRIAQLKIQLPFPVELFKVINTNNSAKLERHFHRCYAADRVNGEWFKLDDLTIGYLLLYPTSTQWPEDEAESYDQWQQVLDAAAMILRQRHYDKLAEEAGDFFKDDEGDYIGNLLISEQLEQECPYPLESEDMEWVVADEEGEE